MISPPGYASLAKLWREFCDTHFPSLYQIATDQYAKDDFNACYSFGSPMDLCELLFTETFDESLVSLVTPSGRIVDLSPNVDGSRSKFFTTSSPFESSMLAKDPVETGLNKIEFMRVGSSQFVPWPHRHGNAEAWRQEYGRPNSIEIRNLRREDVLYHTLPYSYERHRFVVPKTMPLWAHDTFHRHDLDVIFPEYGGSTICMRDDRLETWRGANIEGRNFLDLFLGGSEKTRAKGRPNKQKAIWIAFVGLYPDGRTDSWKKVAAVVREASGLECSERTLQRAIRTYGSDAPSGTTKARKKSDKA